MTTIKYFSCWVKHILAEKLPNATCEKGNNELSNGILKYVVHGLLVSAS